MHSLKRRPSWTTAGVLAAVESVDREVALLAGHVSAENAPGLDDFRRAWGSLVDLLLLGGPPERRMCPSCGGMEPIEATWCSRCRTTLAPVAGSTA